MKKAKKTLAFLFAMVLCIGMMTMNVSAASAEQDGLEVSLTTDKSKYSQGDQITATLTVTNTNDESVSNITMENMIPDGYILADDSESTKEVESLNSGETVSMTVTYSASKSDTEEPSDDNNGSGSAGDSDSSNSNNDSTSSKDNNTGKSNTKSSKSDVQTGDNTNVVFWIVIAVIAGAAIVVTIFARKKKGGKKLLSLFLCLSLTGSLIPMSEIKVDAAEAGKSISIEHNVTVGADTVTLEALVSYGVIDEDLVDSDNDGLIDVDEDAFGTDPTNPDTDGDGFTDYEEIILGTDPLTPNDYDENLDSDLDGLTDLEEVEVYGTDPNNSDTDGDGLTDYDEINLYKTDPTKADTDGDTLSDGFEIEHDLDPNNTSTDGANNDSEIKIEQTISNDGISLTLRDESNLAKPSISGAASGELANNVFLSTSTDSTFIDNRAVIGEAVYVDGSDDYVNELTLSFDLSSYAGGFDNLVVASLNADGNFDIIDSTLNDTVLSCQIEGSGTYCVIDIHELLISLGFDLSPHWEGGAETEVSTFSVGSEEDYYEDPNAVIVDQYATIQEQPEDNVSNDNLDSNTTTESDGETNSAVPEADLNEKQSDESIEETTESASVSVYSEDLGADEYAAQVDENLLRTLNETNDALLSSTVSGQADIVFAIDTTGSMSSTINNVVTNVTSFATTLSDNYNVNVNYALIDFKDLEEDGAGSTKVVKNGSSNWFSNVDAFVEKVDDLAASGGGDTPECSIDALETARQLDFRSSANKFIILITDASYKTANDYGIESLAEEADLLKADGIVTSVVTSTSYQSTYQSLYESTGGIFANIRSSSFSSSLLALADLIGETTSDGTWVILKHGCRYVRLSDETDQDGDGLSTTYELGSEVELDLSPLIYAELIMHGVPIEEYLGETTITVYDAISDPTKSDTDNDGIEDKEDTAPWQKGIADGIIGKMAIISCYVKAEDKSEGWTHGHAFFVYNSYIKDTLDFGNLLSGYSTNTEWKDLAQDSAPNPEYQIKRDSYVSIGGAGGGYESSESSGTGDGIYYNLEFLKYFRNNSYTYSPNAYIEREITQSQWDKFITFCSSDSVNYWTHTHNCSSIACDAWNHLYGDELTAKGLAGWHLFDTPTALKNSILKQTDGKSNYEIVEFLNAPY